MAFVHFRKPKEALGCHVVAFELAVEVFAAGSLQEQLVSSSFLPSPGKALQP